MRSSQLVSLAPDQSGMFFYQLSPSAHKGQALSSSAPWRFILKFGLNRGRSGRSCQGLIRCYYRIVPVPSDPMYGGIVMEVGERKVIYTLFRFCQSRN